MSRNQERVLLVLAGATLGAGALIALALTIQNLDQIGCC